MATAIVVAQIIPLRNGSSVQRLASSSAPITSTNRTIRVMSVRPFSAHFGILTEIDRSGAKISGEACQEDEPMEMSYA